MSDDPNKFDDIFDPDTVETYFEINDPKGLLPGIKFRIDVPERSDSSKFPEGLGPNIFVLEDRKPVPITKPESWTEWMLDDSNCRVGHDTEDGVAVCTFFMGLRIGFDSDENPLFFQTEVSRSRDGETIENHFYTTWDEAEAGHKAMVAKHLATQ